MVLGLLFFFYQELVATFFPAAGYRNYNNGDANNRGNNANYWSSSVNNENNAHNLNFNDGNVNMNNNNRANGYSVRCVEDLHLYFFYDYGDF